MCDVHTVAVYQAHTLYMAARERKMAPKQASMRTLLKIV